MHHIFNCVHSVSQLYFTAYSEVERLERVVSQIMYSTRRLPGFGLTDGEGMERLWSFLRRFARVTKEMTRSHRLDLLTDGLLHYQRRKTADLGQ